MKSGLRVVFLLLLLTGIAAGDIDWSRLVPFRGSKTTTVRATTTTTTKAPAVRDPKPAAGGGFNLADAVGSAETPTAAGECPQRQMIQKLSRMIVKQNELMQNLMNALCRDGRCA